MDVFDLPLGCSGSNHILAKGINIISPTKAGVKKRLEQSAAYPREFGLEVSKLLNPTSSRMSGEITDFTYDAEDEDLGCLNDILFGATRAWWRKL